MILLYSLAVAVALTLSAPWWLLQMARSGRYREGLAERLGRIPQRLRVVPGGVWLHAVSVGEVLAASRLLAELEARGYTVCVSTTTRAGQQLARERFGEARVFYFPLDLAFAVRAWLRAVQPRLLILMESELWPRVLVECERAKVPVVVVNARVSDRSLPRYMALHRLWRPLLAKVALLLAQSEGDARRWESIGAPRVLTAGNLKYDIVSAAGNALADFVRASLPARARVLVCGSTLADEEELLLACWKQLAASTVMLLAPRHPQRFDAVAALVERSGAHLVRFSAWRMRPTVLQCGDILLVDTIGDLAALYALANVAFVGGSIADAGGHNPLEPAQWAVPIVMGPHYANFRTMVEEMRSADAVRIVERDDLCATLAEMLRADGQAMGARARTFFETRAGATERVMQHLIPLLEARP